MSHFETINGNLILYTGPDTHVVVPKGVYMIVDGAFSDCDYIESVELPEGLVKIEGDAFKNCTALKEIKLPESLEDIDMGAFENCKSLRAIAIPKNVNYVSGGSFCGCESLEKITVDEENQFYTSIDNVLFEKDKTVLIKYAPAKRERTYSVPSGVVEISYDVFSDSSSLEYVEIPEGVESIYGSAFENCRSLKGVTLPQSLEHLVFSTFENCTSLKSIVIPKNVKSLPSCTFENCQSLEYVEIQNENIEISEVAFRGCDSLKCIRLPKDFNMTTEWWTKRFSQEVTVVSALEHLDKNTKIVKHLQRDKYSIIDSLVKSKRLDLISQMLDKSPKISLATINELIDYLVGLGSVEANSALLNYKNEHFSKEEIEREEKSSLKKSLGLKCKTIADYKRLFKYQEKDGEIIIKGLKLRENQVEIPEKIGDMVVTEIADYAFENCNWLTTLIIPKTIKKIGPNVFDGVGNLTIYPQVQKKPSGWSKFWNNGLMVVWKK